MCKPLEDQKRKSLTTKIGAGLKERATIRYLESVSSSRSTSLKLANLVRLSATRAGALVIGNNMYARVVG